jgi:4-hydroxybenzoate polyprenyltransferase
VADLPIESKRLIRLAVAMIKVARPVHWIKNLSLFAALIFTQTLLIPAYYITTIIAFIAFNFATSSTYIFNDILDAEKDRLHPAKKLRPVASGELPKSLAFLEAVILAIIALLIAKAVNPLFLFAVVSYLIIQILYSLVLKNLNIVDILVIASGFVLRIYAGAFAINAHLSVWFLLCVISVSLFLAAGKRRTELNTIPDARLTRKSLAKYPRELLNSYVTMFGNASWMSWALFTFFESPRTDTHTWLFLAEISKATTISKLMMVTIPVVIFGIMRYENIIFEEKSEAPEKVLLSDFPLIASVTIWAFLVIWILYGGATV